MTDQELLNDIESIFQNVLELPDLKLTMRSSAEDINEWDSLNHATLIVRVQNHYGLRFSLDEVIQLKTVGDLVQLVRSTAGK